MKFNFSTLAIAMALTVAAPLASASGGGVPEALDRLNGTVNALIATVNRLLTSVNQLVAAHSAGTAVVDKLATSQTDANYALVECQMVNVGPTVIRVSSRLVNGGGGVFASNPAPVDLAPGTGTTLAYTVRVFTQPMRCEFVGADGASLANLRANMTIRLNSPPFTQLAVLEAR